MRNRLRSPLIHADRTVTFVYDNASAQRVSVAGFFNDWQSAEMAKNADGIWEYTTAALPVGTYAYVFHCDGKPTHDPGNPKINHARSGWQSVFDIGDGDYPLSQRMPALSRAHPGAELTLVTLNTHSLQDNHERFRKLCAIGDGLAHVNADIVCLNEIVHGKIYSRGYDGRYCDTARLIQRQVEAASGVRFHLYRQGFAEWQDGENLGNAILCKYPLYHTTFVELTTTDFWPAPNRRRICLSAQVKLAGQRRLNIFATHTMGYDFADTPKQIAEVKQFVARRNTPDVVGSLVMGDFNVPYGHRYHDILLEQTPTFVDLWLQAHPGRAGTPTTTDGKPRIDYVLWANGRADTRPEILRAELLFTGSPVDGHASPVVSDHFGVLIRLRAPWA